MVDLCQCSIEKKGRQGKLARGRRRHERTEYGCNRRTKNGNHLAGGRQESKDGGVWEAHQCKVAENDGACDGTHGELTAYIGAQCPEQIIEQAKYAGTRRRRKQLREPDFNALPVFEEIKRDKDDDDKVHEFPKCCEQKGQRGTQKIGTETAQPCEQARQLCLEKARVLEKWQILQTQADMRQFCNELLKCRHKREREYHENACEQCNKGHDHERRSNGTRDFPAL